MPRYKTNPLEADVQFFEQMIEKDLSGYQDIVGTVAPLVASDSSLTNARGFIG